MMLKVFSVYDTALEAFLQPFFAPTRGSAIRMFSDTVNDPSTAMAKHHADYVLYELGEWDDQTGSIVCHAPQVIGPGTMFRMEK